MSDTGPVGRSETCTRSWNDTAATGGQSCHTQVHGGRRQLHDTQAKAQVDSYYCFLNLEYFIKIVW